MSSITGSSITCFRTCVFRVYSILIALTIARFLQATKISIKRTFKNPIFVEKIETKLLKVAIISRYNDTDQVEKKNLYTRKPSKSLDSWIIQSKLRQIPWRNKGIDQNEGEQKTPSARRQWRSNYGRRSIRRCRRGDVGGRGGASGPSTDAAAAIVSSWLDGGARSSGFPKLPVRPLNPRLIDGHKSGCTRSSKSEQDSTGQTRKRSIQATNIKSTNQSPL